MTPKPEPEQRSRDGVRAFAVVLVVAAVGLAIVGLPFVHGGPTTTAQADSTPDVESYATISEAESELEPADEIYLREDGSAVLRYDDDVDVDRLDLSMDAAEGLVYMLVVDDADTDEEFERANVSAVLDRSGFSADGSLVVERPDDVTDLHGEVSGELSDETNEFEATASGTFESPSADAGAVATDGYVTVTPDRIESSGTASVTGEIDGASDGSTFEVSLQGTDGGYALDVTDERTLPEESVGNWETREQAERTLERQYGGVATELGGTSEIHLSHYALDERSSGQYALELAFTVEYAGIDAGVEEQLAAALATDEEVDLSESEAEAIADRATELEIDTLEVSMSESGDSVDVAWNVALGNTDELSLAIVDVLEASGELAEEDVADVRTAVEAQQAADLEWTLEWGGSAEQTPTDELQFDVEVTSETENWGAYVEELDENGIDLENGVSFDLSVDTDGEELVVEGEFEVEAEDLARRTVESWADSLENDPTAPSEAERVVTSLLDADLEVARADVGVDDGTVHLEGGAKFEDASAVADLVSDDVAVSGIATEQTDDTASMYAYVDDVEDVDVESASRSDLEHLGVVDSETTIHGPGEWDEEFPEADTAAIAEYLGVDTDEGDDSDGNETASDADADDEDSVPGFGAVAAVAALLTALALGRRAQ